MSTKSPHLSALEWLITLSLATIQFSEVQLEEFAKKYGVFLRNAAKKSVWRRNARVFAQNGVTICSRSLYLSGGKFFLVMKQGWQWPWTKRKDFKLYWTWKPEEPGIRTEEPRRTIARKQNRDNLLTTRFSNEPAQALIISNWFRPETSVGAECRKYWSQNVHNFCLMTSLFCKTNPQHVLDNMFNNMLQRCFLKHFYPDLFFALIDILQDSCKNFASFESACKILAGFKFTHHYGKDQTPHCSYKSTIALWQTIIKS